MRDDWKMGLGPGRPSYCQAGAALKAPSQGQSQTDDLENGQLKARSTIVLKR